MLRKVLPVTPKLADTPARKGSNLALSVPTAPRQRSWVNEALNPGTRSLWKVLLRVGVIHPVSPGSLARSKS